MKPPKPSPASERTRLAPLLLTYLSPQGGRVALLALALVAGVALQLAGPQLTSRFIDVVARDKARAPLGELEWLAGLFIAVTVAAQLVRMAGAYFSSSVGWAATNQLRLDLARHCLALDMGFHNRRTAGELIERIDGDVSSLTQVFSQFVFQILGSGLLILGILAVLFVKSVWVGAALSLFAAAAFAVLQRTRNLGVPLFAAVRQARADLAGFVEERLGGLDDIRANGGGEHVMGQMGALNSDLTTRGVRAIRVAAVFIVLVTNGVFITGFTLALGLGVWLFQQGRASIGSIYLLVQYTAMLRSPLEQIGTQFQALQQAMASLGRVRELQATPEKITGGPGAGWGSSAPAISFEHVGFAYDEGAAVLHDISFRLAPGETLGLLGRTGSGKTTITRLLARLYDPAAGAVRLDGRDLRDARLDELRAHVGVVTQDVQLFRADIRENLTLFDPTLPDARLIEALQDLGLGPWFARQPQGLDTLLEAGAGQLSAGEAQLLAFARVFLRDPGLVVLDEASSRLDPATEALIEDTLQRLLGRVGASKRPRTAVIVAHRLATVARVDRIMILEAGRIVEEGERAALAADPTSRFARLLRTGLEEVLA
ncbi:MAG TPA: ABC transporter ATP-binding protein [Caulobacteraceae bacterium]|nr:ABC transporter ATP-binding protein [Caulobacteraceae bacterium]